MDNKGIEHTTLTTILRTPTEYVRGKYDSFAVGDNSLRQPVGHVNSVLSQEANSALEAPIRMEELLHAVKKEKSHKAPGKDGISQEFFKYKWDIIQHNMLEILVK